MRAAAFLVLCSALAADIALAEASGVLPIDATDMGSAEAKLKREVPMVLQDVLKDRYRAVPDVDVVGGVARCTESPGCLQEAAAAVGADELVWVKATRPTPEQDADVYANLRLLLFDSQGVPLLRFEQTITNSTGVIDLRALVVRALAPVAYSGRLQLRGVGAGDEVLIDGLRLDERNETALRPGLHEARVRSPGPRPEIKVAFVVPFEGLVVVDVATSEPSAVISPLLPVWVHGATAAVSASLLLGVLANALTAPASDPDLHLPLGIAAATTAAASTTALLLTLLTERTP